MASQQTLIELADKLAATCELLSEIQTILETEVRLEGGKVYPENQKHWDTVESLLCSISNDSYDLRLTICERNK